MSVGETVHLSPQQIPSDYHCRCDYCRRPIGELRQPAGDYYSRLERREYYAPEETRKEDGSGHIAKTPLHIARWAVQKYSRPGDWVLDPTIGAGTTAVEALTQGRNVSGMELEYGTVLKANIEKALLMPGARDCAACVAQGDARNIGEFLQRMDTPRRKMEFDLVVNNPPYSGDVSAFPQRDGEGKVTGNHSYLYDKSLPNLAHLKESKEYWDTMGDIYDACVDRLKLGGHFVIGVKDMVRNKEPYLLHFKFTELMLGNDEVEFVGTAFLRHHPGTFHLNRAIKEENKAVAQYQTISVFRKVRP